MPQSDSKSRSSGSLLGAHPSLSAEPPDDHPGSSALAEKQPTGRAKTVHPVQNRVRLDMLEALRGPALQQLLHEGAETLLSRHGIHLAGEIDHDTAMRLYAFLNTYD